jgi:hypothetical protein
MLDKSVAEDSIILGELESIGDKLDQLNHYAYILKEFDFKYWKMKKMIQSDNNAIASNKCYKCGSTLYEAKNGNIKCYKCNRIRGKILR